MLRTMSLRTLRLWQLYEQLEPWRTGDEPYRARPVSSLPKPAEVARKLERALGMMGKAKKRGGR